MKHLYILLAISLLGFACSDDDLPVVLPESTGEWTDLATGEVYNYVRIGNQEWMTSNLKAGIPYFAAEYDLNKYGDWLGTYFSGTEEGTPAEQQDFARYGNLYEWETACEVCESLGDGWRLPTDEDWQQLEIALGMSAGEAADEGWRGEGVADLLRQGEGGTGLGLQLSGNASFHGRPYSMGVRFVKEKGFFWTSTQDEDGRVYYRKLHYNSSEVYRMSTDPLSVPMMRVRCVRDATN